VRTLHEVKVSEHTWPDAVRPTSSSAALLVRWPIWWWHFLALFFALISAVINYVLAVYG
jgi:hypothetical protein